MADADGGFGFPKLTELKYASWADSMEARLKRKALWRIVMDTKVAPAATEVAAYDAYLEAVDKAAGEILGMVSDGQKTALKVIKDDPKKLWEELADIHSSKKPGVRFNALDSLFAIQLGANETFPSLVTRVSTALASVQDKRDASYTIDTLDEELFSLTLLRALPAQENAFRSALMLKDKLGKKEMVEAFGNEWEDRKHRKKAEGFPAALAMAASAVPCALCKTTAHLLSACPFLASSQAFVQRTNERSKGNNNSNNNNRNNNNNNNNKPKQNANSATATASTPTPEFAGNASSSIDPFHPLQLDTDFRLNTDTGATAHMTPHRHWLRNYEPIRLGLWQ